VPYVAGAETLPWHLGVSPVDLAAILRPSVVDLHIEDLSGNPDLWGGAVADERFALVART
jgi:hypothetical protein